MDRRTARFSLELPSAAGITVDVDCDCLVEMIPSILYDTPFGPMRGEEPGSVELIEAVFVVSDKDGNELYKDEDYNPSSEVMKLISDKAQEEITGWKSRRIKEIFDPVFGV